MKALLPILFPSAGIDWLHDTPDGTLKRVVQTTEGINPP
jgi:hypothetical protein